MTCWSKEHAAKIAKSVSEYYKNNPRARENLREMYKNGIPNKELAILRSVETNVGGFWYGNVRNDKKKQSWERKYCELWNEDLKERIRAYWGYASVLSGLPETSIHKDKTLRSISCHHIYYQPKACCVWDEDENGYYANVNIGTRKIPIIERYYIEGDPNKFVTLTAKEHTQTNKNKIRWIKTFEKLIEEQGGKCYFTKQEIENLLKEEQIEISDPNHLTYSGDILNR